MKSSSFPSNEHTSQTELNIFNDASSSICPDSSTLPASLPTKRRVGRPSTKNLTSNSGSAKNTKAERPVLLTLIERVDRNRVIEFFYAENLKMKSDKPPRPDKPHKQTSSLIADTIKDYIDNNGVVEREYRAGSGEDSNDHERIYSGGKGLQAFPKEVRAFFCAPMNYTDLDLVNAHPNCLREICKEREIETPALNDYCENPTWYRNTFPNFKIDFLIKLYGPVQKVNDHKSEKVKALWKEIYDIAEKLTGEKPNDVNTGSKISHLCQARKRELVDELMGICKENGLEIVANCFDGIIVNKPAESHAVIHSLAKFNAAHSGAHQVAVKPWCDLSHVKIRDKFSFDYIDDESTFSKLKGDFKSISKSKHYGIGKLELIILCTRVIRSTTGKIWITKEHRGKINERPLKNLDTWFDFKSGPRIHLSTLIEDDFAPLFMFLLVFFFPFQKKESLKIGILLSKCRFPNSQASSLKRTPKRNP